MKQLMKAKHMVEATKVCGEKVTCDKCGKVILDTTQVKYDSDCIIGFNKCDVWYHRVRIESPDKIIDEYDACSAKCISEFFKMYTDMVDREEKGYKFQVYDVCENVGKILIRYYHAQDSIEQISLSEWENYKKFAVPVR